MACVERVSPIVKAPSRVVKSFIPNTTPEITTLSIYTFQTGKYTIVQVTGKNFFPSGASYIKFGNYTTNVSYLGSSNISFQLPIQVPNSPPLSPGVYDVQVITVDSRAQVYPIKLYSNKVQFTLT
jgi:hypothetical protein